MRDTVRATLIPCSLCSPQSGPKSGWPWAPASPPRVRGMAAQVGISGHIAKLRAAVGHDLLLLPSVSVLPVDAAGRLLLVRHAGHHDGWAVLGRAVEVGESPAQAAVRETVKRSASRSGWYDCWTSWAARTTKSATRTATGPPT